MDDGSRNRYNIESVLVERDKIVYTIVQYPGGLITIRIAFTIDLKRRYYGMEIKKLFYLIKPPCPKCPYTLGLVHTAFNPCPGCRANGYQTYEHFQRGRTGRSDNAER